MKKFIILNIIALFLITISACRKEGIDGNATVVALPAHHGTSVKGATIYVKFDATELPEDPTTNYDAKYVGTADEDHVHIENLKWGNYFFYAVAFDSVELKTVRGGVATKIKYSERKEEVKVNIGVTED